MRMLALAAGLLLLAAAWAGPLLDEWRESFLAGMVAHMIVVAAAAPLIAAGLPDGIRPGRSMPAFVPVVASVAELVVIWTWHAPRLRAAVDDSALLTVAEQSSFLAVGVLLWSTCFAAPGQRTHALAGAGALLMTSIHMTLLGALLALSPRPLYGSDNVTCFGVVLEAGQDQQLGGVIMLLAGSAAYLAGGLVLAGRLLANAPTRLESAPR